MAGPALFPSIRPCSGALVRMHKSVCIKSLKMLKSLHNRFENITFDV